MEPNVSHFTYQDLAAKMNGLIPGHCQAGLLDYIMKGQETGDFLYAILTNDLRRSCERADEINKHAIFNYVQFLYSYAPARCWGDKMAVQDWIERGGIAGKD